MKEQRILFLDHSPALGGAERSLLLLLAHLDEARWRPLLACPPGALANEAERQGVETRLVDLPRLRRSWRSPLSWLGRAKHLASLAREMGVAVVYANTVRATVYGAAAAKLARRPFVWHMRDFWLSEGRPRHLLPDRAGKWLLGRAAALVICNSEAVARHLPRRNKVVVVHNGIDVDRFDPALSGDPFRRENNIPAGAPLVGMVGRLRPWKGQERFLRMAALVAESVPNCHFLVAGGSPFNVKGEYPLRLRQLAAQLGLAERVTFTGHLDDVRPALAALDIFVHPGDPEPFGLVNVEAMAMAKPVVALAHGALPEIVVDGVTGLLDDSLSAAGLAQAVIALLGSAERRRQMGLAGRQRARSLFTIERVVAEVDRLLQGVVEGGR